MSDRPSTVLGPCTRCATGGDRGPGCEHCAGTGWERDLSCDLCGTHGWWPTTVWREGATNFKPGVWRIDCPGCDGTGEVQAGDPVDLASRERWDGVCLAGAGGSAHLGNEDAPIIFWAMFKPGFGIVGIDEATAVHLCATGRWPDDD